MVIYMLIIQNGYIIDPKSGLNAAADVAIKNAKIFGISKTGFNTYGCDVIDATGCIVAPGLVDMHVHFRDPGLTYKEDIHTGAAAAAAGGVTTAVCMPNTIPVIDSPETVRYVLDTAKDAAVHVIPFGAVTVGQKGITLTDQQALKSAGVAALSDDGIPIGSANVMRRALIEAKRNGLLISSHCEDAEMVQNYACNEGEISEKLGLPGRPAVAEELMIARDVMLAADTGARVHIAHVSTARSVEIIRQAKRAGVYVTAETCPQYFTITEDELLRCGTMARVNPPLRTAADVDAIVRGLLDGTIDAIVTDHAPHSAEEKARSLETAPSGMVGLETSLGLSLTMLYHTGLFNIADVIRCMSVRPAEILGLNKGKIGVGDCADIVIFDPNEKWTVQPERFKSKGKNTPFTGMELQGRVKYTIVNGKIVYKGE